MAVRQRASVAGRRVHGALALLIAGAACSCGGRLTTKQGLGLQGAGGTDAGVGSPRGADAGVGTGVPGDSGPPTPPRLVDGGPGAGGTGPSRGDASAAGGVATDAGGITPISDVVVCPPDAGTSGGVTQVMSGSSHVCAVDRDGQVWCWGGNFSGQLGRGASGANDATPAPVPLPVATAVYAGPDAVTTCARSTQGELWCWGNNDWSQIGPRPPVNADIPSPVRIDSLSKVRRAWTDNQDTCAVDETGALFCLGANVDSQLGSPPVASTTALRIAGIDHVVDVAVGFGFICAVRGDGTVWCWGDGKNGMLGAPPPDPGCQCAAVPQRVPGLTDVREVQAATDYACARRADGTVWCWGTPTVYGPLVEGFTFGPPEPPRRLLGIPPVAGLALGSDFFGCAWTAAGEVWCWGNNTDGALGRSFTSQTEGPGKVRGLRRVVSVSAGYGHACALDCAGRVQCWGYGADQELGPGASGSTPTAIDVTGLP